MRYEIIGAKITFLSRTEGKRMELKGKGKEKMDAGRRRMIEVVGESGKVGWQAPEKAPADPMAMYAANPVASTSTSSAATAAAAPKSLRNLLNTPDATPPPAGSSASAALAAIDVEELPNTPPEREEYTRNWLVFGNTDEEPITRQQELEAVFGEHEEEWESERVQKPRAMKDGEGKRAFLFLASSVEFLPLTLLSPPLFSLSLLHAAPIDSAPLRPLPHHRSPSALPRPPHPNSLRHPRSLQDSPFPPHRAANLRLQRRSRRVYRDEWAGRGERGGGELGKEGGEGGADVGRRGGYEGDTGGGGSGDEELDERWRRGRRRRRREEGVAAGWRRRVRFAVAFPAAAIRLPAAAAAARLLPAHLSALPLTKPVRQPKCRRRSAFR